MYLPSKVTLILKHHSQHTGLQLVLTPNETDLLRSLYRFPKQKHWRGRGISTKELRNFLLQMETAKTY